MRNRNRSQLPLSLSLCWLIFILFFAGCQHKLTDKSKEVPEGLLVLPGATDVQFSTRGGEQQVAYQIEICYPAKTVIAEISKGMLQKGWVLQDEDYLNRGAKTNHTRDEWSTFEDQKGDYVYQWFEDWKNPAGDIIRYYLRYTAKDRENPTLNCKMAIYGIYTPKKIVDEVLSHLPSNPR